MALKAPAIPLYTYLINERSRRFQILFYQVLVLVITFLTYTAYHLAKRPFSVVKGKLGPECNVTEENNTCFPWKPFDNPEKNNDLFGLLDCAFLTSYALAMFVSGYIAEHTNLRLYLSGGMIITGILTSAFGFAFYLNIHSLYYFFLMQILTGIFQSTGWPCVVEAVSSWFPGGRRGVIMGIWNTHLFLGNILGSLLAGCFVEYNWGLSFIVPGVIIFFVGIIVFLFLVNHPAQVKLSKKNEFVNTQTYYSSTIELDNQDPSAETSANLDGIDYEHAINICGALRIPGVIEYSLCLFFAKLVSYTFLFWLPFYIAHIKVAGQIFGPESAADYAVFFDIGAIIGGIIAGALSDHTRCPGMINVVFLLLAGPTLFIFKFYGQSSLWFFVFLMFLSGVFVNGPYALITTAVSASLGTHPCLDGNTKAIAVVTAIIDGTGSLGSAVGPLLAGVISGHGNWNSVFYLLIAADIAAALLLSRQFWNEVINVINRKGKQEEKESLLDSEAE